MPALGKGPNLGADQLALTLPCAAKQCLLIAAAMTSEIIPADILVAGIDELLEVGKTESWRLAQDRGELMSWVELFAFSDRPKPFSMSIGCRRNIPTPLRSIACCRRLARAPMTARSASFERSGGVIRASLSGMIGLMP